MEKASKTKLQRTKTCDTKKTKKRKKWKWKAEHYLEFLQRMICYVADDIDSNGLKSAIIFIKPGMYGGRHVLLSSWIRNWTPTSTNKETLRDVKKKLEEPDDPYHWEIYP